MTNPYSKHTTSKGYGRNAGKRWRYEDVRDLKQLAQQGAPLRLISLRLGRPDSAIRAKAESLNLTINTQSAFIAPAPKRTLKRAHTAAPAQSHKRPKSEYQGELFA